MTLPEKSSDSTAPADPESSSVETDADTTGSAKIPAEASGALAKLTDSDLSTRDRRRLLGRAVSGFGRGAGRAMRGPRAAAGWAADLLIAAAPHLTVRDLETLQRHYEGKSGDELADAVIRNAARTTASLGAAGGGIAAVEWTAPPSLLSAPILLAVETAAVVAVEVKLLAELHEVYGTPVRGSASERASALLTAWARRRGVTLLQGGRGFTTVLGAGMRKELRDRLLRRMGRNLTTLGPLFTGAAIGAELNRRATRKLGDEVRADLRKGYKLPPADDRPALY
ncbi:hypothetical protein [Cryptosporangium sp. NPDC048952]|uniref:hypothetical protein n=1 Tax=Cryptosporangium sp. NPDC048952 TaxID=3363961 RepID=UPI00372253B3